MSDKDLHNDELRDIFKNSLIQPRDPDFDDKIMQRIHIIGEKKKLNKKNVRLSWIFLFFSIIVFPLSYIFIFDSVNFF